MTHTDFRSIATAAGIPDLAAHGAMARFCRLLQLPANQHQGVRTALKNGDPLPQYAVDAANNLRKELASGVFTPPAAAMADGIGTIDTERLPVDPEDAMTDDELLGQINRRFSYMRRFVQHAIAGRFHSVLITGPGGIGKTHPVEAMLRDVDDDTRVVKMVSGAISAVGLVEALWETREKGSVLLIDDADGGLANDDFRNVLKAATDSKGRRVVSWLKQNRSLAEAGVEPQFEFMGSVIIISNANLKERADRNPHIEAILSRAMHIDLGINSPRALALRVAYMIQVEEMFAQMFAAAGLSELHEQAKMEIGEFIKQNATSFRSLTLREAAKVARMYLAEEGSHEWADMALLTVGQL